jgi:hypothetical protein
MDVEAFRPVISGALGGVAAALFCSVWAKWVPEAVGRKSRAWLAHTYRRAIAAADSVLVLGICSSPALYWFAGSGDQDWRAPCLGIGGSCVAALLLLAAMPLLTGGSPRDAYVGYAVSRRMPIPVLFGIHVTGAALFAAALGSLLG